MIYLLFFVPTYVVSTSHTDYSTGNTWTVIQCVCPHSETNRKNSRIISGAPSTYYHKRPTLSPRTYCKWQKTTVDCSVRSTSTWPLPRWRIWSVNDSRQVIAFSTSATIWSSRNIDRIYEARMGDRLPNWLHSLVCREKLIDDVLMNLFADPGTDVPVHLGKLSLLCRSHPRNKNDQFF